nr:right-handed parallel beta-helix repeat-containing protein [Chloroflexota bacterium]
LLLGGPAGAVRNITITTNSSFNDIVAINLSDVQKVLVYNNTVTQDAGGPQGAGSAFRIGGFSGGAQTTSVQVISNTITSPHFAGVAIRENADGVVVARNVIKGTEMGVDNTSTAPGAAVIRYNTITNTLNAGIYMHSGTSQNLITNNTVSGGSPNCQDDTTGPDTYGLANSWSANGCVPA